MVNFYFEALKMGMIIIKFFPFHYTRKSLGRKGDRKRGRLNTDIIIRE